jgi:UDP-N-acetylmuramoyl-tripeptide--D-alanyl-D-alanine ligase
MIGAVWLAAVVGYGLAGLRWLRVAQREHYLPFTVSRFAWRWWNTHVANRTLLVAGLGAVALAVLYPAVGLTTAVIVASGPLGFSITGRTAPLRWTARLKRLAATTAVISVVLVLAGFVLGSPAVAMLAAGLLMPVLVDLALEVIAPLEHRLSGSFVAQAGRTLAQVAPIVVAITGSYGKTTTKAYLARLLRDSHATVASPASFNNRLGLARAINEHLTAGTEVFIAEMGTYGKGEIAELCSWIEPSVGVITAIGPVHLERFGSLDKIVQAKAEIFESAHTAVLNVDDPRLAVLADQADRGVIKCSTQDPGADVFIDGAGDGGVYVRGTRVATLDDASIFPGNLSCALGAALAIGVPMAGIERAVGDLPGAEHRQTVSVSDLGFTIVDDTYNSNPTGARSALETLERLDTGGRLVLVTPGMVELGQRQYEENVALATLAVGRVTDLVIVGRTNRAALREGTAGGGASVIVVDSREDAVDWVRAHLGDGDVVLYENDLPDHYP